MSGKDQVRVSYTLFLVFTITTSRYILRWTSSRTKWGWVIQGVLQGVKWTQEELVWLNCQGWFQLNFKGDHKKHFSPNLLFSSELKTQKSFQVYLSLTLIRVKLVWTLYKHFIPSSSRNYYLQPSRSGSEHSYWTWRGWWRRGRIWTRRRGSCGRQSPVKREVCPTFSESHSKTIPKIIF